MEQENNIMNTQDNTTVTASEQNNAMAGGVSEKIESGKGMLYGMILCAILAIGGIGFGVWAMVDGNSRKNSCEEQISTLKSRISELIQQNTDLQVQIDNQKEQTTDDKNEDQDDDVIDNISSTWPVTASLVGEEIYFTNSDDEVVAKDSFYSFVSIKDCTTLEEEKVLRCGTETTIDKEGDNDRGVIYHGENGKIEHWSASGV